MHFINNYINKVKKIANSLRFGINIPETIKNTSEKKLLHISDTPDCIYPFIFKVIEELDPDIIVHTGDLVDNVKLEYGASISRYYNGLKELTIYLEKNIDRDIYFIPGNHDSVEILQRETKHIKLIDEGSVVNISGIDFGLAHFLERLPLKSMINLYGHNKKIYNAGDRIFLNGLLNINIILLPSLNINKLSYPLKTNNARKYKNLSLP